MIITTTVTLPDGRAFELSLEPVFKRDGHRVENFVIHMIDEQPKQPTKGDIERADNALRLVG